MKVCISAALIVGPAETSADTGGPITVKTVEVDRGCEAGTDTDGEGDESLEVSSASTNRDRHY